MIKKYALLFGIITALFALLSSCRIDRQTIGGNERDWEGSEKWMSKIDGERALFSLSIPGTHDSCANYDFLFLSSTAAAQDLSLIEQLNAGVRFLDIRPYHEKNGSFTIHHGPQYQHMSYDDVLSICYSFLEEYSSECIIFGVYNENRTESENENIGNMVKSKIDDAPERWLDVDSKKIGEVSLEQARGKLVLLKRFNGAQGYGIEKKDYEYIGAPSKTKDLNAHWQACFASLEEQRQNRQSKVKIINASGYFEGQFGIPNIRIASSHINTRLLEYLADKEGGHCTFGPVVTDHISKRLAHAIYSAN